MEEITIQIKDKFKRQALLDFLKTLDFVENIRQTELSVADATEPNQDEFFFSLSGLWADRETTLSSLRQEAWRKEKSLLEVEGIDLNLSTDEILDSIAKGRKPYK